MPDTESNTVIFERSFAIVTALVAILVIVLAGIAGRDMTDIFASAGNDEVMRLVSVRNWLGGQGWFDTTEYRLMPPDGILLHWSRYVDAAIAAIIVPLSWFGSMDMAEMWAVTIWPTLLMLVLVLVIGVGARRLFGPVAAIVAVLCTLLWPLIYSYYFSAGNIDHHNVQILMMVLMTLAIIWPDRPVVSGAFSGVFVAFALAIGLETLPYILVLGTLLLVRATYKFTPIAERLLLAFCAVLPVASVAFWLGQTSADRLLHPFCDQLGIPVLTLISIAVVASATPILLGLHKPVLRLVVSVALAGTGLGIAWPFLGHCAAGPYALLPVEVQDVIKGHILEALPGFSFALRFPYQYNTMITPAIATVVLGGLLWLRDRRDPAIDKKQTDVVGQLLVLSIVGILASFSQIRLLVMATATIPFLAGYVLASAFAMYRRNRSGSSAAGLMIASMFILAPFVINDPLKQVFETSSPSAEVFDGNCRDYDAMATLNDLPPSTVLTPMNQGPLMLLATHHSGLSGPYHRSPDAFANGLLPFRMNEAELKAHVLQIGAQHLMVCARTNYGDSYVTKLANEGAETDWLHPVPLEAGDILVFEVIASGGG